MTKLKQLLKSASGATAIEYGLFAGLLSIGLYVALVGTSAGLQESFGNTSTKLQAINS